jgi:transcriptional regulator with XRE-family HTH domain
MSHPATATQHSLRPGQRRPERPIDLDVCAKRLGQQVVAARLRLDQPREMVATVAGVSYDCLKKLELGQGLPTVTTLVKVASALGVPASELLAEEPAAPGPEKTSRARSGRPVAGTAAYLSVRFVMRYFLTRTLTPFAMYCLIFGGASFIHFAL